jgi:hypothetical protein
VDATYMQMSLEEEQWKLEHIIQIFKLKKTRMSDEEAFKQTNRLATVCGLKDQFNQIIGEKNGNQNHK